VFGFVLVRVDVVGGDTTSASVLGVERGPPDAQLIAQLLVAVPAEVRDDVALLLREVRVVRLATGQEPPTRRGCAHSATN